MYYPYQSKFYHRSTFLTFHSQSQFTFPSSIWSFRDHQNRSWFSLFHHHKRPFIRPFRSWWRLLLFFTCWASFRHFSSLIMADSWPHLNGQSWLSSLLVTFSIGIFSPRFYQKRAGINRFLFVFRHLLWLWSINRCATFYTSHHSNGWSFFKHYAFNHFTQWHFGSFIFGQTLS